jgi:hypothetical protein
MLTLMKFLNYTLSIELLSFFCKFSLLITLIILNSRRPINPKQAVLLGKKALQDQRLMKLLWQQFKNQTNIALILGG